MTIYLVERGSYGDTPPLVFLRVENAKAYVESEVDKWAAKGSEIMRWPEYPNTVRIGDGYFLTINETETED